MNPTLLIGLDGATFTVLDHLMDNGTMPFLKEFAGSGVRAKLRSTSNPLTPPAWISLMTGRNPGQHGVIDFIWAEQRKTEHYFTLYNFMDIRSETIWSMVSRQDGKVCSLNFPMMSPPPSVSGSIVPGLVSWKHLRRNVHPEGLYERLKELPEFNARDLAWDFDLEKKAEKGVPEEEYEGWVEFHKRRERQWFEVARYLMLNEPSDLTAVLFDGPDKIFHMGYRFLDPKVFPESALPWERNMRDLCYSYFNELDGYLEKIVGLAEPGTRVFMVSDHGFGPTWEVFRVNAWLNSMGYLAWKDLDGLDENNRKKAMKVADRHFVLLDWDKTTAYARTSTSNGIYIRVAQEPGQPGVPPEQYEDFRSRLIKDLMEVRDPESGERIIKRVMTKEEAYPGENNMQAPDLTIVTRDHGFISIVNKEPVVFKRPYVEGTHYPDGVFLANGPGIRKGETVSSFSIEDTAPCCLYSLGLDIPRDLDGKMPSQVFEASYLESHPPKEGEPTVTPESFTKNTAGAEDDQEQIFERLRALGYIE